MKWKVAALVIAAAALASVPVILASGGYELSWWNVGAGGRTFSTGEGYTLGSTVGQPDANVLRGEGYTLAGGFWPGGRTVVTYRCIYIPLVLRETLSKSG
jgi:hypothetical protein